MDNNLKNRIQKLMETEQMSPASFAKAIQVNPSAISHILNERNKPSTDILTKILTHFHSLNSEWLILGVGNMYKDDKQGSSDSYRPSLFSTEQESHLEKTEENQAKNSFYEQKQDIFTHPAVSEPINIPSQSPNIIEKEVIKEVLVEKPEKKVQKIIVYYSDNSFEEFNSFTSK